MNVRRFHQCVVAFGVGALLLSGCSASVSVGPAETSVVGSEAASEAVEMLDFDTAALAAEIADAVGKPVTVDCPGDIPLQKGLVTECLVMDGTYTNKLTLTQDDDQGNVTWLIGEVVSGPAEAESGSTESGLAESAAPSDTETAGAAGTLPPVTTPAELEALFMTDEEMAALLPSLGMGPQWADGTQGPTAWDRGNRVLPEKCQIFEDFGRLGAGSVPDGPLAWVGGMGWTSERRNANDIGDNVTETIAVYRDEATALAEYEAMAALAEDCATYRFPDRTDITRSRVDSVEVSADPPMIAWGVVSPDDGAVAWIGTAVWLGDRMIDVEIMRTFRDDDALLDAYPSIFEAALTRAAGMDAAEG
jgi:hypothetical protein